jgi:two-component system chemotaxis sensor kinase CheA
MPKVRVMDELLREFLTETGENLDTVDVELVRFEQEPDNAKILGNIFRLVHTIKGTCGFLNLPRLEALTHAAETVMGKLRDGAPATTEAVSTILATIDRIKDILAVIEATEREPEGGDADLIGALEQIAMRQARAPAAAPAAAPAYTTGTLTYQVRERPLRPGEVSLDELERAFRETPVDPEPNQTPASPPPEAPPPALEGEAEAAAEEAKDEPRAATSSIRVGVETLEQLMTMVSELVLTRNQLLEIGRRHEDSEFKTPLQRLSAVTAELQEGVMKARMQPIGHAWQKLPRLVRDLCADLGKEIELQTFGAETELDRQVLELIRDPLTHMVRNSADHGLEAPDERQRLGKPRRGTIRLSARHEGGHIVIEIADDGRGLDTDRIRQKAIAQGLVSEAEAAQLNDTQIQRLIFVPGLSTAAQITSISGRGVGMDVVKNNIDQIGGAIDVKSVRGEGSAYVLKIPLTLAIVSALIVESAGERFAIPQLAVVELVRSRADSEHRIEYIKGAPILRLRDKLLPLVHLGTLLKLEDKASSTIGDGFIVVMHVGNQRFGIVVDGLFHTEEIVVKPMAAKLRHIGMFSGAAILGDGAVIMILDPNGVAETVGTVASQVTDVDANAATLSEPTTSLLVFRAGSQTQKAVPLSLVTRLEEIECSAVEMSNGRPVVQYRGHLMPLARVDDSCKVKERGVQPVLVFSDGGRAVGLLVDDIVDIVEDRLAIDVIGEAPGIIGSAIVKGQATEIIDVGHFLTLAFDGQRLAGPGAAATGAQMLMLVDDSPFFRDLLPPVLKAAGYDVRVFTSGAEALAALRDGARPAAILCDLEMPEMDGLQFAALVRSEFAAAPIPMLALSSHADAALMERVRAAGFDDFVAKLDRRRLVAAVKEQTSAWEQAA